MNRVFSHRRSVYVIVMSAVAAAMVAGCKPHTRDNPDVCNPAVGDNCAEGMMCNDSYRCVANGGAGGTGDTTGTGGTLAEGGAGGQPASGGGKVGSGGATSTGGAGGRGGTGAAGKAGGAGGTTPQCNDTKACQDSTKVCLTGVCVECKTDSECQGKKPICSPQHMCQSCTDAGVNSCASHLDRPVCATGGDSIGACVKCDKHKDCQGKTPLCSASLNECVGCDNNASCLTANAKVPICVMTGTSAGACVECGKDSECSADPNKPFCSATGTCVGCDPAMKDACGIRVPGKLVCSSTGACVQCLKNLDCESKTPVCSSANTCGSCTVDKNCEGRYGPTICMTTDGHCAVAEETIYVQSSATCSDSSTTAGGTETAPYCSLQMVPAVVTPTRNLVVVRGSVNNSPMPFGGGAQQLWIVGQQNALIGGVNAGIRLTAGEATIRDITISNNATIGIQAETGSTLRLQHVNVSNNMAGGILLDGAAFDIQNTTVKGNGPGDMAGTAWGGIRIASPSTAGPKQLLNVTVQANNGGGISCSGAVSGTGVLSIDNTNTPTQIAPSCSITSCATASATCGAQ